MPNMRIIYNNVADSATITADNTAGTNEAANLKTDYKGQVHRSTGTTVTYTLTWAAGQSIGGIVLPCTNLSSQATIRVRLYTGSYTQSFDSGTIAACPNTSLEQWPAPRDANIFAYGGLSKTSMWWNSVNNSITKIDITLTDTSTNSPGYIDCSRVICGTYWQPTYNVSRDGLDITITDSSGASRTDSGDLISEQGFVYDELSLNLELLTDSDRDTLVGIMRRIGTRKNIAVCVFPENTGTAIPNNTSQQIYTVYGKRDNNSLNYVLSGFNSHQIKITGW